MHTCDTRTALQRLAIVSMCNLWTFIYTPNITPTLIHSPNRTSTTTGINKTYRTWNFATNLQFHKNVAVIQVFTEQCVTAMDGECLAAIVASLLPFMGWQMSDWVTLHICLANKACCMTMATDVKRSLFLVELAPWSHFKERITNNCELNCLQFDTTDFTLAVENCSEPISLLNK